LDALEESGVDGVQVERLARDLGVAKSGFYWHFKDRADLLGQLLEFWETGYTKIVISNPRTLKGTPEQRLLRVMQMIEAGNLAGFDIAFHAWAQKDKLARDAVDRVMRQREEFIGGILREMGFEGEDLEMRTMLFVLYNSCETMVFGFKSTRKRKSTKKRLFALICEK
jgi:AcrR family transcriptional regulator